MPIPPPKPAYAHNASAYLSKLRTLDDGIAACLRRVPASQRKLVTDHDAFGYFARRYAITVVGAVIPSQSTQAQPSAGGVARLVGLIRREHVRAVFPESSVNPKLAPAIAAQTGAASNLTLYGDTLGPRTIAGSHVPDHGTRQRRRDGSRIHRRHGALRSPRNLTGSRRECEPL